VGSGDEFFSLRPFRDGDDPRRVAWRRTAKTGRMVVREHEATQSREIVVVLRAAKSADADRVEDGIATVGSLVEDLVADGHAVGVAAGGERIAPARGARQRVTVLGALSRLNVADVSAEGVVGGSAAVVVVAIGNVDLSDADIVIDAVPRAARATLRRA
jgi:uncharacterized protein (DUF58 family)